MSKKKKLKKVTGKAWDKKVRKYQQYCGEFLRTIMHEKCVTTTELAQAVGMSQAQISRLACGLQGFRSATLFKICNALGVDTNEILPDPTVNTNR